MFKMEPVEDLIAELDELKRQFENDLPPGIAAAASHPKGARNPASAQERQGSSPHPRASAASVAPRRGRMRYPKALRDLPRDPFLSPPAERRSSSRHSRKCAVCNHPQRAEIERRFLRWHSQSQIAEDFRLYDRLAVYRHAKATGLLHRRVRNLNAALEHILEQGSCIPVTGSVVVGAVKKYAMLQNQWHEPPRQVIVHYVHDDSSGLTTPATDRSAHPNPETIAVSQDSFPDFPASSTQPPSPNRHTHRIENRRNSLKRKGRRSR